MALRPAGHVEGCGCPICRRVDESIRREATTEEQDREADGLGDNGEERPPGWSRDTQPSPTVHVDMGRGQTVPVEAGAPFASTLERLADEAHYGGYFRVFLNGSEVINPEDAPANIEAGMRIAVTSYDKVGL